MIPDGFSAHVPQISAPSKRELQQVRRHVRELTHVLPVLAESLDAVSASGQGLTGREQ